MSTMSRGADDPAYEQYREVCLDLNMDGRTMNEAWNNYRQVKQHYSLEGNRLHWLACSLYVASRNGRVPSVTPQNGPVQGNFISLTRLLRSCQLSLLEFFDKSIKWADMSNMPASFRKNLDSLQRNFAVTMFLFKNYFEPIFSRLFGDRTADAPRPPKSRKQRRSACNRSDLFQFTWTLFVLVKSHIAAVSCDLVSTYHLLLACVDFVHGACVVDDRRDLLQLDSAALPADFAAADYEPPVEPAGILEFLCDEFDGLIVEVKGIRQHSLKEKLMMLYSSNVLLGDPRTSKGTLEADVFESSCKSMNKWYEEYLLTCGNFDERTFLGGSSSEEIGMPSRTNNYSVTAGDLAHRIMLRRSLMLEHAEPEPLVPTTPLTGRGYLRGAEPPSGDQSVVSASMQSVARLQALLGGREPQPSAELQAMMSACDEDPREAIQTQVQELETQFLVACTSHLDGRLEAKHLAQRRFSMATTLYYKQLESIMLAERRRKPDIDLLVLLKQNVFHRCLLSCSLEIVLVAYNTASLEFPWLLDALSIEPYDFYKLLEIIIREEQGLCRDIIKHLSKVEEQILDSMAWRSSSRLWTVVEAAGGRIPNSEAVALPADLPPLQSRLDALDGRRVLVTPSPVSAGAAPLRSIRRICMDRPVSAGAQQSPVSSMASDRFMSPVSSSARRRLFAAPTSAAPPTPNRLTVKPTRTRVLTFSGAPLVASVVTTTASRPAPQQPATPPPKLSTNNETSDVKCEASEESKPVAPKLTPLKSPDPPVSSQSSSNGKVAADAASVTKGKQNSLGLFFRKFYHLAWVRMRDLCDRLELSSEVRQTIWTVFEFVIINHLSVMEGRHLDQLIMSSVFVVCKAFGINKKFTDIMGMYRLQPQARSHVYRSVLLGVRPKNGSADGAVMTEADGQKSEMMTPGGVAGGVCPPTPSQLAGSATSYRFEDRDEERGDIIQFYNQVFVQRVKMFLGRFTKPGDDKPPLSPLPSPRHSPLPIRSRVCHQVYISPMKPPPASLLHDRSSVRSYSFSRSPANDLRSINAMLSTPPPPTVLRVTPRRGVSLLPPQPRSLPSSPRVLQILSTTAVTGGVARTVQAAAAVAKPQEKFKARLKRVIDHRQANTGAD